MQKKIVKIKTKHKHCVVYYSCVMFRDKKNSKLIVLLSILFLLVQNTMNVILSRNFTPE